MMRILVPTDFSLESRYAAEFACQLSEITEVDITLLHISELPSSVAADPLGYAVPIPYGEDFMDQLRERGETQLANFASQYLKCGVTQKLIIGNAFSSITDYVDQNEADLIIMGTKGASGVKEFFLGSNAAKVIRTAPCPVISLGERVDAFGIKNIVYATNLMDASKHLIRRLRNLQKLFGATVHILRVNTPNNFESDPVAEKLLQNLAHRFGLENYTINSYNDLHEEGGIQSFAESIDADLIALGTHGRRGLNRLLTGSLAEEMVNHTKLPVWSCNFKPNKH